MNWIKTTLTNLWRQLISWRDQTDPKFKLTPETINDLEILGGVDWTNDDEWLRQRLELCETLAKREELYDQVMEERRFVEIERNRERLAHSFALMTPKVIAEIEAKVAAKQPIYVTNVEDYLRPADTRREELEF